MGIKLELNDGRDKFCRVYGGEGLWDLVGMLGGLGWMVLSWMSLRMGYRTNVVRVWMSEKEEMGELFGVGVRSIERSLGLMVDLGLVVKMGRGVYMVSPVYFSRGSEGDRDRLIGVYYGLSNVGGD